MFLSKIPNVDMLLDNMKNYVFMVFHFKYCISDIYIRIKEGSILIPRHLKSQLMIMKISYAIFLIVLIIDLGQYCTTKER